MEHLNAPYCTPLKIIENPKGNILHGLKGGEDSFSGFGEAYFSNIHCDEIKGWKKHTRMTLNLVVPVGNIQFVICDDRNGTKQFYDFTIGEQNYQRLTVPPGVWVAFKGKNTRQNLLLNLASITHDPSESENIDLDAILFDW